MTKKTWRVVFTESAEKIFSKLDRPIQKKIAHYLDTHVTGSSDPRRSGKALTGPLRGLWRYRVGDYRIICHIQDAVVTVVVVAVGPRKDIYD